MCSYDLILDFFIESLSLPPQIKSKLILTSIGYSRENTCAVSVSITDDQTTSSMLKHFL